MREDCVKNRIRIYTYDELVSSHQEGRDACEEKRERIKYNANRFNGIVVDEENYFLIGGGGVYCSKLIWASLNGRV